MPARRFFVADRHEVGDRLTMTGSDAHKIAHVLRLVSGDDIEVADSAARLYRASLEISGASVVATLREAIAVAGGGEAPIDVAQGLPKGAKMDFVVEKATELGARAILPFVSERSIARDVPAAKVERWSRLARAAAAQSGRTILPSIPPPLTFDALLERFSDYDLVLFPWELAPQTPLREILPGKLAGARGVLLVVGPEGGFSHAEAERAADAGALVVSLGREILRTESVALVLLSILRYLIME